MGFTDDMRRFEVRVDATLRGSFVDIVSETTRSLVEGSELTGSPGQPVDTGALRSSFQTTFESPTVALIATNIAYAPPIEDAIGAFGPLTLRSQVGGFHSSKLTQAGFPRIVAAVVARSRA